MTQYTPHYNMLLLIGVTREVATSLVQGLVNSASLVGEDGRKTIARDPVKLEQGDFFVLGRMVAFILGQAQMCCQIFSESFVGHLCRAHSMAMTLEDVPNKELQTLIKEVTFDEYVPS